MSPLVAIVNDMNLLAASGYQWHWSVVWSHDMYVVVRMGLEYTLIASGLALIFGNVLGLAVALARVSGLTPLKQLAYIYTEFFRTTPALVQLIWIFYVLPILSGVTLSPLASGVIALSLNSGAFLSEIFRGGLESINRGQRDAAHVLGFSRRQAYRHVILPQALRRVLPAAGNVFISLLKDSSLLSVIAVPEITYQTQSFVTYSFRPLELYTVLALLYFCITYPISLFTRGLERRFRVT
jgi:His/Glu/Gln/Arg/opine family amino acid ABC transporter permease subunit